MSPSTDVVLGTADAAAPGPRWRRWLAGLLVLVLVALFARQAWPHPAPPPFDPDDPGAHGTRALVQVLRHGGVTVDVVRTRESLAAARVDDRTTLVTAASPNLTAAGLDAFAERTADADRVVVLGLGNNALDDLGLPLERTPAADDRVHAGSACTVEAARHAPVLGPVTATYRRPADWKDSPDGPSWTLDGCYVVGGGSALVRLAAHDATPVDAFAPAGLLTNQAVTAHDAAALGLRLLGETPHVVWFAPGPGDVHSGDTRASDPPVAPGWFRQLVVLLVGVLALTMWWRGRRLGPLAVEPLPVIVHAAETTLARGRLYRRAKARAHAASVLRTATARRLVARLGLPRDADTDDLVAAVAAGGRAPDAVRDTLAGPDPTTDAQLAQVAQDLAALEEGTHR